MPPLTPGRLSKETPLAAIDAERRPALNRHGDEIRPTAVQSWPFTSSHVIMPRLGIFPTVSVRLGHTARHLNTPFFVFTS